MVSKRGRPTNDPKTLSTRIRLSEKDIEKLLYLSNTFGKTKAEVIRMGIDRLYQKEKEK